MVETAFIFIVFACLLFGAFDFGQFLFTHQAIVERVRWAARKGTAVTVIETWDIENMIVHGETGLGPGDYHPGHSRYFNLTHDNVDVTTQGTAGAEDYRVLISISGYQYKTISPYLAGTYNTPTLNLTIPLGMWF